MWQTLKDKKIKLFVSLVKRDFPLIQRMFFNVSFNKILTASVNNSHLK